jgi:hypothetical protein
MGDCCVRYSENLSEEVETRKQAAEEVYQFALVFSSAQINWSVLPGTLVETEDGSGFCGKVRIAMKEVLADFLHREPRQWDPVLSDYVTDSTLKYVIVFRHSCT